MKSLYSKIFCAFAATAVTFSVGILNAAPQTQPPKPTIKRINWAPLQKEVNEAIKAKDWKRYDAALNAIAGQSEDTFGKLGELLRAVSNRRDPDFAIPYLQNMLKGNLNDKDKATVNGALLGTYAAKAAALNKAGDDKGFATIIATMEKMPDDIRGKQWTIINAATGNPVFAEKYLQKIKFQDPKDSERLNQIVFENYKKLGKYYADTGDRAAFDALIKKIEAFPEGTVGRISAIAALAQYRDGYQTREYLEKLLLKTQNPQEQFDILAALRTETPISHNPYMYIEAENYKLHKEYWKKQNALLLADEQLPAKERKIRGAVSYRNAAQFWVYPFAFGDFKFSEEVLDVWYKGAGDKDVFCAKARMKNAIRKHDAATAEAIAKSEVTDILRKRLTEPRYVNNPRMILSVFRDLAVVSGLSVFNTSMDFAAFDKAVFADYKFSTEERYRILSYASSEAFLAGRHDISQAITKEIYDNMLVAPERLTFQVKYDVNCPKSADAWLRSSYADWKQLETRFKLYCSYYEDSHELTVKRLLKDVSSEPQIPEENRAGVCFLYDNECLHIFVRVNDPQAGEIMADGTGRRPSFEMLFRPGEEYAYHSDYLQHFPAVEQTFPQDWQRPGVDYTLTKDILRRDTAIAESSVAVHYAIPFSSFFDKLPSSKRVWTFGLQVWGKSNLTLSCGVVHELARMGNINFSITAEQMIAIKRLILKKSVNHATRLFGKQGELPRLWADPVIGDPDFYNQEVKPLFDKILGLKDKIDTMSDAEINACYDEYALLGLKFEYIIAEKRAQYIKNSLLK